jgi:DnaK suppressor protein
LVNGRGQSCGDIRAGKSLRALYTQIAMNTEPFKQRLLEKERELVEQMARLGDEARDSGEAGVRDSTDDATSSQSTSEALQEDALASQTLTEVQDALKRIADGTYGKCAACGRQIEAPRLEAVPWAVYCLEDQEK